MHGYKSPNFQERQQLAAQARTAALNLYRNRPPVDEAAMAERAARRKAREAAEAEKRAAAVRAREAEAQAKREEERRAAEAAEAAKKAEAEAAKAASQAATQAKAEAKALKVAERKNWTEEDRKAARDARYAARKARQQRR